jgi:hypothetical protein
LLVRELMAARRAVEVALKSGKPEPLALARKASTTQKLRSASAGRSGGTTVRQI